MHLKVTVFWLGTLKLLLMIPTLLNYLPRFTATTKCFPRRFRRLRVRSTLLKKHTLTSQLSTRKKIVWASEACIKKRMLKNCDMENIVNLKQEVIFPALYAELQRCQPTTAAVERSLSMLGKLLRKDRPFSLENVEKYLCLYYNKYRL